LHVIKPTKMHACTWCHARLRRNYIQRASALITSQASFVGLDKKLSNPASRIQISPKGCMKSRLCLGCNPP
jgi:hypothetical protein